MQSISRGGALTILKPHRVAAALVEGCETTIEDFRRKIIADEINMTDRLVASISNSLNGKHIGGIVWKARTLRNGPGVAAEERRHGADVLGTLEVDTPEYKVRKGFLLQSKIIEPGHPLSLGEWQRFQQQCEKMLQRTNEAFGMIFSRKKGVRFIPAQTLVAIRSDQVFEAGSRTLHGFFRSHVKCEIGDRKLNQPTIEILDDMVQARTIKDGRILAIKATQD